MMNTRIQALFLSVLVVLIYYAGYLLGSGQL